MARNVLDREPLTAPLRTAPSVDFDAMSDEEIARFIAQEDTNDRYAIPEHIMPDGMKYQWVRYEVFGQPDNRRVAEMEQRGWLSVPADRHDGLFMTPGTKGPTLLDGMILMEIPDRVLKAKRYHAAKVAAEKVSDMNAQLVYAPPGTGPRDAHRSIEPRVVRKQGVMDIHVE
jgi:hypothetical protein